MELDGGYRQLTGCAILDFHDTCEAEGCPSISFSTPIMQSDASETSLGAALHKSPSLVDGILCNRRDYSSM